MTVDSYCVAKGDDFNTISITENPVILSVLQSAADIQIIMIAGGNHTLIHAKPESKDLRSFKTIAVQGKDATQKILRRASLAQNDKLVSVFKLAEK